MFRAATPCALLALLPAATSGAQGLPYRVTIVTLAPAVAARQSQVYRALAEAGEVLVCVEAWRSFRVVRGFDSVVVDRVRTERIGERYRLDDVGDSCLDPHGRPLPMIHTHSEGVCQLSPQDYVTLVARNAPFEGVQCGDRHFTYAQAWQVLAVANAIERTRFTSRPGVHP